MNRTRSEAQFSTTQYKNSTEILASWQSENMLRSRLRKLKPRESGSSMVSTSLRLFQPPAFVRFAIWKKLNLWKLSSQMILILLPLSWCVKTLSSISVPKISSRVRNKLPLILIVYTEDAIDLMNMMRKDKKFYDVVDLDPYGTAVPFLESAI